MLNLRRIGLATLICGSLDIIYAFVASGLLKGKTPLEVLQGVATGPFGSDATGWGVTGALLGALTHYSIMAVMVAVGFALLSPRRFTRLLRWSVATTYGLALYLVMYGIVLPLRFGAPFPNPDTFALVVWALPHWLCVAWPLAWMATKGAATRSPATS